MLCTRSCHRPLRLGPVAHGSGTQKQGRSSADRCSPATSPPWWCTRCQRVHHAEPHRREGWDGPVAWRPTRPRQCSRRRERGRPRSALTLTTAAVSERKRGKGPRRSCWRRESRNGVAVRELDAGRARRRARQLRRPPGILKRRTRGRESENGEGGSDRGLEGGAGPVRTG